MADTENKEVKTEVTVVENESMFNKVKNTIKDHKVIAIAALSAAGLFVAAKVGAAIGRSEKVDDFDDDFYYDDDELDDPVVDEVKEDD